MAPPTDSCGSSSINRGGKSFFEVFPREIRDHIYDYTFDHDINDGYYRYQFRAPQPHLRLVSRQFLHEYDEQTPSDATLFVAGCNDRCIYTPSRFLGESVLPRLAARCTSADMLYHIGESDGFHEDIDDEQDRVCDSLDDRVNDFCDFIESLPLLQTVKIQFSLNFIQTFDVVYENLDDFWSAFRYENGESYLSPDITIELRHLELNFPNLPASFIEGFDVLKQPATLATFSYSPGCVEETTQNESEIEHRGKVEDAVLTAWKAQHGRTLVGSVRKAAGIKARIKLKRRPRFTDSAWN